MDFANTIATAGNLQEVVSMLEQDNNLNLPDGEKRRRKKSGIVPLIESQQFFHRSSQTNNSACSHSAFLSRPLFDFSKHKTELNQNFIYIRLFMSDSYLNKKGFSVFDGFGFVDLFFHFLLECPLGRSLRLIVQATKCNPH